MTPRSACPTAIWSTVAWLMADDHEQFLGDDYSEPFDLQYRTLKHHKKKLKKIVTSHIWLTTVKSLLMIKVITRVVHAKMLGNFYLLPKLTFTVNFINLFDLEISPTVDVQVTRASDWQYMSYGWHQYHICHENLLVVKTRCKWRYFWDGHNFKICLTDVPRSSFFIILKSLV